MEPHNHHRRSRIMRRDAYARHRREGAEGIEVVTDVVFVTASVSGGGKVIGFTTLGEAVEKTPSPSPTTVAPPKVTSKAASSERPRATTSETPKTTEAIRTQSAISSTEPTEVASPTSTLATSTSAIASNSESILALTSTSASASETSIAPTASITSSAAPSSEESASGGMSTGATVGLAVAGVGVFLVICFTLAFVYRKRSQKKTQEAYGKPEDEKTGAAAAVGATVYMNGNNNLSRADTITSEKAPRVPSLRPVTQFLPNLTVTPPAADPVSQRQSQAQVQSRPQQRAPVIASSPVGLTRSESRKAPPPALVLVKSEGEVSSAPVSSATTTNSTAPLLAKTQTSPTASSSSSSSLVEYTDSGDSAAGTPVTGGPAGVANTSPVHRVQMDFKPSMEDELGLRVGQLVRLLYEYDDGWALCIRLDRSQQGVCPRTCLSQRPVKPRHPGSPRPGYPNGRAQSPIGSQGSPRPYSPSGVPRAQSPGSNRSQLSQSPVQMRPQSPAQAHPKSPAGYVKQVYRPATATQQAQLRIIPASPVQRPQSPITQSPVALRAGPSQITVTTTTPAVISEAAPPTPVSSAQKPQSPPGSPPRPAVAPVRPSPLSNEQTSGHEPEHAQPVFHAM